MSGDWEDYDSGPFCRHWASLLDADGCGRTCTRCGHKCERHYGDALECEEDGCGCEDFQPHACAYGACSRCKPIAAGPVTPPA